MEMFMWKGGFRGVEEEVGVTQEFEMTEFHHAREKRRHFMEKG